MWRVPKFSSSPPSLSSFVSFPVFDPVPVTVPAPGPVPILCSSSGLHPRSRHRSLLPVPRTRLPPRYNARVRTPDLTNGAVGCPQAPLPVCRDDDACGMKVPAVKQKKNTAEDVLHASPPPNAGTRWSVSPTCAQLVLPIRLGCQRFLPLFSLFNIPARPPPSPLPLPPPPPAPAWTSRVPIRLS